MGNNSKMQPAETMTPIDPRPKGLGSFLLCIGLVDMYRVAAGSSGRPCRPYKPRKVPKIMTIRSHLICPSMIHYNRDNRKEIRGGLVNIVQLLSGGFDSVGQALLLQNAGHTIFPLYVRFRRAGGKQTKELNIVQRISKEQNFKDPVVIDHPIGKEQYDTRNRTLCQIAERHANSINADAIAIGAPTGHINIGNVPDDDLDIALLEASVNIKLFTVGMFKSTILKELDNAQRRILFQTSSCQLWYKEECGQCYICVERHAAFIVVLGYDHTQYTVDPKVSKHWSALIEQEATGYHVTRSKPYGKD